MSVDLTLPIGPFLRLSIADYRKTLNGAELSAKMLDEALTKAHEEWHAFRKPKKKAKPVQTEAEWLQTLRDDPFMAGINIDAELAKCQFWCRQQKPERKATRATFTNWLGRATGNAAINSPGGPRTGPSGAPKPDPGPAGWLAWVRENMPGWVGLQANPVPEWHTLDSQTKHAIRSQMKGTP